MTTNPQPKITPQQFYALVVTGTFREMTEHEQMGLAGASKLARILPLDELGETLVVDFEDGFHAEVITEGHSFLLEKGKWVVVGELSPPGRS